jgi:hypothetical protein
VSKVTILFEDDDGRRYAFECLDAALSIESHTPKLTFTAHDYRIVMPPLAIEEAAAVFNLTPESFSKYLETKDPEVLVRPTPVSESPSDTSPGAE